MESFIFPTELSAITQTIKKWEDLQHSRCRVGAALCRCELCYYYKEPSESTTPFGDSAYQVEYKTQGNRYLMCFECSLALVGHACLNPDSPYLKLSSLLADENHVIKDFSLKNLPKHLHTEVNSIIDEMLIHLYKVKEFIVDKAKQMKLPSLESESSIGEDNG